MRVSGIETFLGGADNVIALEILQGEQRVLEGTLKDSDGDVIDLSDYTLEAMNEFYLADVTTTSRTTTITSLTAETPDNSGTVSVAKGSDPAEGKFTLTIPEDLYDDAITADIATDVPICVAYVRYSDGAPGGAGVVSRVSRFVIIIRRSQFN